MIIKLGMDTIEKAMTTVTAITNDKNLKDDLKNLIVWLKKDKTYFVANNGNISSLTLVEAMVDFEGQPEEETFIQLRAKDINDVVASMKGLKRTKVTSVEFHVTENEAVMFVYEEAIDPEMAFAESYKQVSKHRVTKTRIKDIVKSEIQNINMDVEGEAVPSLDLKLYIDALYPTVSKETREATSNVMFDNDYVFTRLPSYAALMKSELPDVCKGYRLPNNYVAFLRNFAYDEVIHIDKNDLGNGLVILTLKNSDSVAQIKCADMSRAYDITPCIEIPNEGIAVDKMYLLDVLKRVNKGNDPIFVEITTKDGEGTFKVISKTMTQEIPVTRAKGEGSYAFSIRGDLLANVIMSHVSVFDETIYLYFEYADRNIVMACTDCLGLWHTKMMGLTESRGDFDWK